MNLADMRRYYEAKGYSRLLATARVCQDVVLSKIAASPMSKNVTVKGGVLMCALSGEARRATQDIDLDFVRYPISEDAIRSFVGILSNVGDGIAVEVVGDIVALSQQDYEGKRVMIRLSDGKNSFDTKLDLGVHAQLEMEQDECWFDLAMDDEGVSLLANSKEQAFAEKLKSLLRHGVRSTRYRDLYDMYYFGHRDDFDRRRLRSYIDVAIINDEGMWDGDMEGIATRVERTVTNRQFLARMRTSHRDWLGKSAQEVAEWLPRFLRKL